MVAKRVPEVKVRTIVVLDTKGQAFYDKRGFSTDATRYEECPFWTVNAALKGDSVGIASWALVRNTKQHKALVIRSSFTESTLRKRIFDVLPGSPELDFMLRGIEHHRPATNNKARKADVKRWGKNLAKRTFAFAV